MRSRHTIATPPGATIKEQLTDRGMSQKEFAQRMDMSEKHISKLINGEVRLTPNVAIRLESVLGVPADFWSRLEARFQEKLERVKSENEMDEDIEFIGKLPYKDMVKNRWVKETKDAKERVVECRRFFEVARLGVTDQLMLPGIAFRRTSANESSDYKLAVWAQRARIEAREIPTAPMNIERLKESIPRIREMTSENPEHFCPRLIEILSDCGVALVFLPHIGGSFLHGASFYDGNKIVLGITVRGKYADIFWFSLFHEINHILAGHIGEPGGATDAGERQSDRFAADTLIPAEQYGAFVEVGEFSYEGIIGFARAVGIDPGIVVGRLQKDGYVDYSWHNSLRSKYGLQSE